MRDYNIVHEDGKHKLVKLEDGIIVGEKIFTHLIDAEFEGLLWRFEDAWKILAR